MSFLITGLPRIRSAWFSALLDCHHDSLRTFGEIRTDIDLCDPSVACLYPESDFDRVVVIDRNPDESRASFENWSGIRLTDTFWAQTLDNYQRLIERTSPLMVRFDGLSDEVVSEVCRHVGKPQTMDKIRRFQLLKVEQK